jgi:hypothetical protein
MEAVHSVWIIRTGDIEGLDKVYSESGGLILKSGERTLKVAEGWDLDIISPWRRILPKTVFSGFGGQASSKLYVTTERLVLVRNIDVWREVKGELTPLGLPAAAAKEIHLKELKSSGAMQFCELRPRQLRVVRKKRMDKRWSWLDLRVLGDDGKQYAITVWKTDGVDPDTLSLIESQFAV